MLLVPEQMKAHAEEVARLIEEGDYDAAARQATNISYARNAIILSEASTDAVIPYLRALGHVRAAHTLTELPAAFAAELIEEVEENEAAAWIAAMPADVIADLIAHLDDDHAEKLLARLTEDARSRVHRLARYPEDTAGGAMSPYFLAVPAGTQVRAAIEAVRTAPVQVARTSYVYVVDTGGRLQGVLSLREMMLSDPAKTVDQIMAQHVIAARVDDDAFEAADRLRTRRLKMMPVVTEDDVLVGVITIEDALDILSERLVEGFSGIGAVSREESFFTPPQKAIRMRLPWMAGNVFLNLGAVAVIASFEDTIAQVAILAAFLPMITDMGGNVGIQSLSVSIRSIALGEVRLRDHWQAVRKELFIGLANGVALGTLFAFLAWIMEGNVLLGLVAGSALAVNVLVAGVVGGTMPFFIKRMGRDPAMMTGPILTTITDITGVTIYLGMATIFLAGLMG